MNMFPFCFYNCTNFSWYSGPPTTLILSQTNVTIYAIWLKKETSMFPVALTHCILAVKFGCSFSKPKYQKKLNTKWFFDLNMLKTSCLCLCFKSNIWGWFQLIWEINTKNDWPFIYGIVFVCISFCSVDTKDCALPFSIHKIKNEKLHHTLKFLDILLETYLFSLLALLLLRSLK